ncbi:Internalin-A precursor [Caballeronia choica]|uniref:Internalin-A n=1 Tax=Caballeronia choica TaxID=326476 RepID=A0A158KVQ7_9BURK|nr:leucine-rich repeat domain-containing protein [Caballeronia choica]SAL85256.1 Internalin-A precursor [Caballeronia choica]
MNGRTIHEKYMERTVPPKNAYWPPDPIELVNFLRSVDFHLGTGDILRTVALLEYLASEGRAPRGPAEAAQWLAPILCTSPYQQANLVEYFKTFSRRIEFETGGSPSITFRIARVPRRWLIAGAWVAFLLASILIVSLLPKFYYSLPAMPLSSTIFASRGASEIAQPVEQPVNIPSGSRSSNIQNKEGNVQFIAGCLLEAALLAGAIVIGRQFYSQSRRRNRSVLNRAEDSVDGQDVAELDTPLGGLRLFDFRDVVNTTGEQRGPTSYRRDVARQIHRAAQDMRRYRSIRTRKPDIRASVRASATVGGYPLLVSGRRPRLPDYAILVEAQAARDHLPVLGRAIADCLQRESVHSTVYFFDTDPRLLRDDSDEEDSVSLADVAARHDQDTLILLTDGECLFDPFSGEMHWWTSEFKSWRNVVLLTPVQLHRWSWRERSVAVAGLIVVPATPRGLSTLGEFLLSSSRRAPQAFDQPPAQLSVLGQEGVRALQWHLDRKLNDEELEELLDAIALELSPNAFELMCVLALFPELRPELTLYAGSALCDVRGKSLLDEASYAALCVLPWFRAGRMPDWLRLELGQSLSPERTAEARAMYNKWLSTLETAARTGTGVRIAIDRDATLQGTDDNKTKVLCDRIFLTFLNEGDLGSLDLAVSDETVHNLLRAVTGSAEIKKDIRNWPDWTRGRRRWIIRSSAGLALLVLLLSPSILSDLQNSQEQQTLAALGFTSTTCYGTTAKLDASGCLIWAMPPTLSDSALAAAITHLKRLQTTGGLVIVNSHIQDIHLLGELPGLQFLTLSNSPVQNIDVLSELRDLRVLNLEGTKVENIDPLKVLVRLKSLNLSRTRVGNIDAVRGLTNLQALYLTDTPVQNIDVLAGMTNLRVLFLGDTNVANIDALSSLTGLQVLNLDNTKIRNVDALGSLTALRELSLKGTPVRNVDALQKLSGLEVLDLEDTSVQDTRSLERLTNLTTLKLPAGLTQGVNGLPSCQDIVGGENDIAEGYSSYSRAMKSYRLVKDEQVRLIQLRYPGNIRSLNIGMYKQKEDAASAVQEDVRNRVSNRLTQSDQYESAFASVVATCLRFEKEATRHATVADPQCAIDATGARTAARSLTKESADFQSLSAKSRQAAADRMAQRPGVDAPQDIAAYTAHVDFFDRRYAEIDDAANKLEQAVADLNNAVSKMRSACGVPITGNPH